MLEVKPAWFKLAGQEVIAVSTHRGRPMIVNADDGAILWTALVHGESSNVPVWMQSPNGSIHLAIEAVGGVQIYDSNT